MKKENGKSCRRSRLAALFLASIPLVFFATGWFLYDHSWRFRSSVQTLKRIGFDRIGIAKTTLGEPVRIEAGDIRIAGGWYPPPPSNRPAAGILLLHGSSIYGRKLGLYPLLAEQLNRRGYSVLAVELRGFGESDDPPCLDRVACLDSLQDAFHGLDYLKNRPGIDATRLYVLGHSLGGGIAIRMGAIDSSLRGVIAIGPPRRLLSRFENEAEALRERYARDRELGERPPPEVFAEFVRIEAPESVLPSYSHGSHPPLLLLDGTEESREDRLYLEDLSARIAPPVRRHTIPHADHYLNVVWMPGTPWAGYDRSLLESVIDLMDRWMATLNAISGEAISIDVEG